jgi:hypothetical protein
MASHSSERGEGEHEKLALERNAWGRDSFTGVDRCGSGAKRRQRRLHECHAQGRLRLLRYRFILPQVVVGIGRFDGKGGFTQVDYIGDSLRTTGATSFRGGETGSYTVNPDCTGSQEIKLNVPGVPAGTSHGVIENMFVISSGGRSIHGVVAEVTPPGASQPVRTQTRVDFWKVGSEQDN